jgi:hypothetical protein
VAAPPIEPTGVQDVAIFADAKQRRREAAAYCRW